MSEAKSADADFLATGGSYAPSHNLKSNQLTQTEIYNDLCSQIEYLSINNCYTITLSINSKDLKSYYCNSTNIQKFIGNFITQENITKIYYVLEKSSKTNKLHMHGILQAKSKWKYKGISGKYPGTQIYINRFYPRHKSNDIDAVGNEEEGPYDVRYVKRNALNWVKYITKSPLSYVSYKQGKNYIQYSINICK